jgi:hypothetical protein
MSDRPHVFLATPCFGGTVTSAYMQSVMALVQVAPAAGFDLSLGLLGNDALITRCRNTLLGAFLEGPASHLLFVDADIAFPPEAVLRLLRADKDCVAGMYPIKSLAWEHASRHQRLHGEQGEAACLLYVGRPEAASGRKREGSLVSAVYAGTGFMLIARGALVRMTAAYPETRYRAIHAWPLPSGPERERYALFDTLIDPETGTYLSEDYAFCHRFRAIGGQIWLDTEIRLTHVGGHEFHGAPSQRFATEPRAATCNTPLMQSADGRIPALRKEPPAPR